MRQFADLDQDAPPRQYRGPHTEGTPFFRIFFAVVLGNLCTLAVLAAMLYGMVHLAVRQLDRYEKQRQEQKAPARLTVPGQR